jgi:hypothetical protein
VERDFYAEEAGVLVERWIRHREELQAADVSVVPLAGVVLRVRRYWVEGYGPVYRKVVSYLTCSRTRGADLLVV